MRERILAMRRKLHGVISAKVPGRNFDYFLTQRGMFSYTGLSAGAGGPRCARSSRSTWCAPGASAWPG